MGSRGLGYFAGVGGIISCLLAGGCAHKGALAEPPRVESTSQTTTTSAPSAAGPRNDVVLSGDLQRACNIDLGNVETAPKFDFERSDMRPGDRAVLDQVARCVTTGPLKGRALHLVGRADPRGEQEYNMALGSFRASSVGRYLESLGVPSSQITQSSRGKLDAAGHDDATWQLDRRVDID